MQLVYMIVPCAFLTALATTFACFGARVIGAGSSPAIRPWCLLVVVTVHTYIYMTLLRVCAKRSVLAHNSVLFLRSMLFLVNAESAMSNVLHQGCINVRTRPML